MWIHAHKHTVCSCIMGGRDVEAGAWRLVGRFRVQERTQQTRMVRTNFIKRHTKPTPSDQYAPHPTLIRTDHPNHWFGWAVRMDPHPNLIRTNHPNPIRTPSEPHQANGTVRAKRHETVRVRNGRVRNGPSSKRPSPKRSETGRLKRSSSHAAGVRTSVVPTSVVPTLWPRLPSNTSGSSQARVRVGRAFEWDASAQLAEWKRMDHSG